MITSENKIIQHLSIHTSTSVVGAVGGGGGGGVFVVSSFTASTAMAGVLLLLSWSFGWMQAPSPHEYVQHKLSYRIICDKFGHARQTSASVQEAAERTFIYRGSTATKTVLTLCRGRALFLFQHKGAFKCESVAVVEVRQVRLLNRIMCEKIAFSNLFSICCQIYLGWF